MNCQKVWVIVQLLKFSVSTGCAKGTYKVSFQKSTTLRPIICCLMLQWSLLDRSTMLIPALSSCKARYAPLPSNLFPS